MNKGPSQDNILASYYKEDKFLTVKYLNETINNLKAAQKALDSSEFTNINSDKDIKDKIKTTISKYLELYIQFLESQRESIKSIEKFYEYFNPDKALKTNIKDCLVRFIETKENEIYNNSIEFRQEVFQKHQKDKEILKNHLECFKKVCVNRRKYFSDELCKHLESCKGEMNGFKYTYDVNTGKVKFEKAEGRGSDVEKNPLEEYFIKGNNSIYSIFALNEKDLMDFAVYEMKIVLENIKKRIRDLNSIEKELNEQELNQVEDINDFFEKLSHIQELISCILSYFCEDSKKKLHNLIVEIKDDEYKIEKNCGLKLKLSEYLQDVKMFERWEETSKKLNVNEKKEFLEKLDSLKQFEGNVSNYLSEVSLEIFNYVDKWVGVEYLMNKENLEKIKTSVVWLYIVTNCFKETKEKEKIVINLKKLYGNDMKQAIEKFQKVSSFIPYMSSIFGTVLNTRFIFLDTIHPDDKKVLEKQNILEIFREKICRKSNKALDIIAPVLGFYFSTRQAQYVKEE